MATADLLMRVIAVDRASRTFDTVGRKMRDLGTAVAGIGDKMTVGVTLPLLAIGAASVKTASQFEQTMNVMQVNSGATAAQMKQLSDLAIQMGKDTVYSANDAAAAMLELSKGGLKPAQIQAGALKASMNLAATEGLDLAAASTTVVNAMSQFGLKARDATKITDALAAGATASTASVASLSQGLGNVGVSAKQVGFTLTETVAALSAFDQAGIKGAEGGTALRSMLLHLVPTTAKTKSLMDQLGISFVQRNGDIKDLAGITETLQTRLKGLSEAQRTATLKQIFGTYAFQAANVLYKEGVDGVQKYEDAVKKQGVAQDLANARMSGTAGALEQMRGSLETAGLAIGQALAPRVVELSADIKGLADWFTNLDEGTQQTIVKFGLFVAAAGPILSITGRMVSAIAGVRGVLQSTATAFGTAAAKGGAGAGLLGRMGSAASFMSGPWGLAIGGAVTAIGILAVAVRHKATAAISDYTDALIANSGALDRNIKSQVASELAKSGELERVSNLGISTKTYTDAVLGNEKAQRLVAAQLQAVIDQGTTLTHTLGASKGSGLSSVMDDTAKSALELQRQLGLESDKFADAAHNADLVASALGRLTQAQKTLNSAIGSGLAGAGAAGAVAGSGAAAGGFRGRAGGGYLVGEHGPEIVFGSGYVIPHSRTAGRAGGAPTVVNNFFAPVDAVSVGRETAKALRAFKASMGGAALGVA